MSGANCAVQSRELLTGEGVVSRTKGATDIWPRKNPWRHGTMYGYVVRECRCSECREANRVYVAVRRARRKARTEERLPSGDATA